MNNDQERLTKKLDALLEDLTGHGSGLVKIAKPNQMMANTTYQTYRNSFLTLSDMKIPDDFREIFKWCRYFFKFDSLIGPIVRKMATFPITDYVINDSQAAEEDDSIPEEKTSDTYKFYSNVLSELGLHKHLIEIGYDYHTYGNCVVLATPGIKKIKRRNAETGEIVEHSEMVWKTIERLDVQFVRITRDPKTQEKIFYYEVPDNIRRVIRTKSPKAEYDRIPKIFKDAVEKKGIIRLNSKNVFHFSMPTESGDNGLWATPPIMHAFKLIMYTNILRQAQEAIAYEHIIPKRVYFFEPTNQFDASFNFGQVADDFTGELQKQLNDPNYQIVSPIPVNQLQHGGQGRNLLLVPEIEQLQTTILATMGAPREFIFGGLSYSGSTTSLRILENDFITYRQSLEDYVNNFLIKRLAELRGEWETVDDDDKLVKVSFAELKMQDDIQQKELMVRLNQAGKLPDEVLYEKVFGLDGTKVKEQLQTEARDSIKNQSELQIEQMKAQLEVQQAAAEMGVQPPMPAQEGAEDGTTPQGEEMVAPTENPQADASGASGGEQAPTEQQFIEYAQYLSSLADSEAEGLLAQLPADIQQQVAQYYYQLKDQTETETDMRAMPEQLPPRRDGGV